MKKKFFSNDDDFVNTIWLSILLPILSVFCTLGIAYMQNKLGIVDTILFLFGFILILMLSEIAVIFIIKVTHNSKLNEKSDEIIKEEILSSFRDLDVGVIGIKGIYPEAEIAQMERRCMFNTIWLVSHDLQSEVEDGVYSGVVSDNLKKGINYTYFVPKTPEIVARIKMIIERCEHNENLKFYYLNEDFFFLVPEIDFAIYEPFKTNNEGRRGYMGMDIQGLDGRFATIMTPTLIDTLVSQLFEITNHNSEVKL